MLALVTLNILLLVGETLRFVCRKKMGYGERILRKDRMTVKNVKTKYKAEFDST